MIVQPAHILIVDDYPENREVLSRNLVRQGYTVATAEDGLIALEMVQKHAFDLILLDIMMPGMNGYDVLQWLKNHPDWRHIPVIIISASSDIDSMVKGIQLGAEDYLPKPFNAVLLKARIRASLEKKRLRDQEQRTLQALAIEQQKSERLLRSILPQAIADQLKDDPHSVADYFPAVTVLFADVVDFTLLSASVEPRELVRWLNATFSQFDHLTTQYGLEKIKTIGDAYMLAGGLPVARPDHVQAVAHVALAMQQLVATLQAPCGAPLQMRFGIATGPVVAGVIGTTKWSYDLWGETVNLASRMEKHSLPNQIQITAATHAALAMDASFGFTPRNAVEIKGVGLMTTYLLSADTASIEAS